MSYEVYAVVKTDGSPDETLVQLGTIKAEAVPASEEVEAVVSGAYEDRRIEDICNTKPRKEVIGFRVFDKDGTNVSPQIAAQEFSGQRHVERSMAEKG